MSRTLEVKLWRERTIIIDIKIQVRATLTPVSQAEQRIRFFGAGFHGPEKPECRVQM